jgi:hypothetical protein
LRRVAPTLQISCNTRPVFLLPEIEEMKNPPESGQ